MLEGADEEAQARDLCAWDAVKGCTVYVMATMALSVYGQEEDDDFDGDGDDVDAANDDSGWDA